MGILFRSLPLLSIKCNLYFQFLPLATVSAVHQFALALQALRSSRPKPRLRCNPAEGGAEVGDQRSEVGEQRAEVRGRRSEGRGQRSEVRGRRSEVGGRRSEGRGQRSEIGGQRAEIRNQRSEVRGRRSEIRGQRSEIRGRRSEVRGRKAEVRGQRAEDRGNSEFGFLYLVGLKFVRLSSNGGYCFTLCYFSHFCILHPEGFSPFLPVQGPPQPSYRSTDQRWPSPSIQVSFVPLWNPRVEHQPLSA